MIFLLDLFVSDVIIDVIVGVIDDAVDDKNYIVELEVDIINK